MNAKRVAALLRELAEALEQPEPERKRKRARSKPENAPKPEDVDRIRRALRGKGVAA